MGDNVGVHEEGEVGQKAFQADAIPAVRRRGTTIVSLTPLLLVLWHVDLEWFLIGLLL